MNNDSKMPMLFSQSDLEYRFKTLSDRFPDVEKFISSIASEENIMGHFDKVQSVLFDYFYLERHALMFSALLGQSSIFDLHKRSKDLLFRLQAIVQEGLFKFARTSNDQSEEINYIATKYTKSRPLFLIEKDSSLNQLIDEYRKNISDPKKYKIKLSQDQLFSSFEPSDISSVLSSATHVSGSYEIYMTGYNKNLFLKKCRNSEIRKNFYRVWKTRFNENERVLFEIANRRQALAKELGFDSFLDLRLSQMGTDYQNGREAIFTQKKNLLISAKNTLDELKNLKQLENGSDKFYPWDEDYYITKLQRARNTTLDRFEKSLTVEKVIELSLNFVEELFAVSFLSRDESSYHPDAKIYEVIDNQSKDLKGFLYFDLKGREGKHPSFSSGRFWDQEMGENTTISHHVIFASLGTKGSLTVKDLRMVLHELGHCVQGFSSKVKYRELSCTNVPMIEREIISQFFEKLLNHTELFESVLNKCGITEFSTEEIKHIQDGAFFGQGLDLCHQIHFALLDWSLYARPLDPKKDLWDFEAEVLIDEKSLYSDTERTLQVASFWHLASSEVAGSYFDYFISSNYADLLWKKIESKSVNELRETMSLIQIDVFTSGSLKSFGDWIKNF